MSPGRLYRRGVLCRGEAVSFLCSPPAVRRVGWGSADLGMRVGAAGAKCMPNNSRGVTRGPSGAWQMLHHISDKIAAEM